MVESTKSMVWFNFSERVSTKSPEFSDDIPNDPHRLHGVCGCPGTCGRGVPAMRHRGGHGCRDHPGAERSASRWIWDLDMFIPLKDGISMDFKGI